ncbi:hypothetical protein BDV3_001695 [Batrachochytrium dendrobatidis]|nr:hypothetical protein O5D80_007729 [Batrachochytrium dendrobatidis]KAK5666233.1 hypothetical protein QVD99_006999 [Batrachochytrium dendrobatidis]
MDSNETDTPLTILARLSSGQKVPVTILDPANTTVLDLKELVAAAISTSPGSIRLVLRGRILKGDELPISNYAVADKDVVHVARTDPSTANSVAPQPRATTASLPGSGLSETQTAFHYRTTQPQSSTTSNTTPSPGITGSALAAGLSSQSAANGFGGDEMASLMSNPMIQTIFENPEFLQLMLQSDPRMRAMMEENPEIRAALSDPSVLREISRGMQNPRLMQEMMRNQDRALSNIEAIPGGFNHLSSMYRQMNGPLNAGRTPDPSTDEANRQMANLLGATSPSNASGPNSQALPNPWDIRPGNVGTQRPVSLPTSTTLTNMLGTFGAPSSVNRNAASTNTEARHFPFMPFPSLPGNLGNSSTRTPGSDTIQPHLQMLQQMAQMNQSPRASFPNQFDVMPPALSNSNSPMNPFLELFGAPSLSPSQLAQPSGDPAAAQPAIEEQYREQLASLRDMGFVDEEKNKRAILAAGGNTDAAVSYLLDM